jgi:hypothetical protein
MTDLSRDARSLVARARGNDGPSPQDRARIRAKLEPAWAAGIDRASAASSPELLRRWATAKALVLLAVVSWSPSQPQPAASSEHLPPIAAGVAGVPVKPAAPSPDVSPAPLSASASAPVQLEAAAVRASGQLAQARRSTRASAHGLSHGVEAAGNSVARATDPQATLPNPKLPSAGTSAAAAKLASATNTRGAVGSTGATRSTSGVAPSTPSTPSTPAAPARPTTPSTPAAPTRTTVALVNPQNQTAPTQSRTEFKPQAIDDELAWIGAAQEALQNHQPSLALRLVEQHSFRFPDGALTQERLVVHTLALCALERFTAARRMLEVLAQRAPDAPILARVRSNCGL